MTRDEALARLDQSFAQPSATPDHGVVDRESFLKAERAKLRALVIDPIAVVAVPSDWAKRYSDLRGERYEMYAVAGDGKQWLLFDPRTENFSQATGDIRSGAVELTGWASRDALAEWRG